MVIKDVKTTLLRQEVILLSPWTGWGFSTFFALLSFATGATVNFTDQGLCGLQGFQVLGSRY
jgi:hypothetical protein